MASECTDKDATCSEKSAIDLLTEHVDQLYLYRDHYFEQHSLEEACHRSTKVMKEREKALNYFEEMKESGERENRSKFFYLKGRALNIGPQHDPKAEEALSKAIKLDPKLVDAWNELGECYWKKDDTEGAKNCFLGALQHRKDKVSLRSLSMVLRQQQSKSREEKIKNIEEGLAHAKEAVELDASDGVSWSILGNAYLSSFFTISQNPKSLQSAMSAYLQAEKHIVANSDPDLHYNKGIALKYEEEYMEALNSFSQAQRLDPMWDIPKQQEKHLLKYLGDVQNLIKLKGKLKGKKLQNLFQALNTNQLGPYEGGMYAAANGQSVKLDHVHLSQLQPGTNTEKVVLGKVVCSVHSEDAVPFTFCLIDKEETCVAVTVYNLAEGKGVIIGDSVAIPEPYFTQVRIKYKDKEFSFDSIRVESPLIMVVNGRKLGRDQQASAQLFTFKKRD